MRHLKLAIAHQTRWSPVLAAVQRELQAGVIGRVLELRGRGKEDANRGGGEDLWVLGSHVFDLMRSIGGDPRSCFATVQQAGRAAMLADVIDGPEGIGPLVGDQLFATYQFDHGVTGSFASQRGTGGQRVASGCRSSESEGIIDIVTGHIPACHVLRDPTWSPGRSGQTWTPLTSNGVGQPETTPDGNLHGGNVLAVNDLLDCIEEPMRQPKCSVYDARWTVEMIAGVFASHLAGRPLPLPLEDRRNPLAVQPV